jgi:hypothetical protein
MPWYHSIFGLRLQSDEPIEGLEPVPAVPRVDVRLWTRGEDRAPVTGARADARPWYVSAHLDEEGRPLLRIDRLAGEAGFRLCFAGGAEFVVDRVGSRVWAEGTALGPADLAAYLVGPILAFVLRLRGVTCLHASAVAIAGRAVAFVGPQGAGKSTTAAVLARGGCPLITDDLLAVTDPGDTLFAQPGFPRLQLRPAADRHPLHLGLAQDGYRFQERAVPLGTVYVLDGRRGDRSAPSLADLTGGEALISLIANTWATRVLDPPLRAAEFGLLGRLAAAVPIRFLRPNKNPASLERLCEAIAADLDARSCPHPHPVEPGHGSSL